MNVTMWLIKQLECSARLPPPPPTFERENFYWRLISISNKSQRNFNVTHKQSCPKLISFMDDFIVIPYVSMQAGAKTFELYCDSHENSKFDAFAFTAGKIKSLLQCVGGECLELVTFARGLFDFKHKSN